MLWRTESRLVGKKSTARTPLAAASHCISCGFDWIPLWISRRKEVSVVSGNSQELTSSLLHASEVSWSFSYFLIPPLFPYLISTCSILEIMLLPTVSHICPNHQTSATQTKRDQGYVNVKYPVKTWKGSNEWQNAFSSESTYPYSVQHKVLIKTLQITSIKV